MRRNAVRPVWPEALFVYGTLVFPGVLAALLGRVPDHTSAAVAGWRAAALSGEVYPGLIPAAGAVVRGRLLTSLTATEWRIIDAFESDGYDLTELELVDGRRGWAYTWSGDIAPLPHNWSADAFAADHLAAFAARCTEWRSQYDASPRGV